MAEKKVSKAKQTILDMLWNMEWVEGADIFKAVQQTYYDRRIRELRESGWQIQTSGKKYRLVSQEKLAGNKREYPPLPSKSGRFLNETKVFARFVECLMIISSLTTKCHKKDLEKRKSLTFNFFAEHAMLKNAVFVNAVRC
jgi:hypothetical protein